MSTENKKQLHQALNIIDTLLEASDHFSSLIKNKELKQSIFIFSSIVEGAEAVNKIITSSLTDQSIQKDKMERYVLLIAQNLEKGNLTKVAEILQFSFIPQLKNLKNTFSKIVGEQDQNEIITIGIFSAHYNPREFYTEDRVNALVQESRNQTARLLFFTSKDVDFDSKQIEADEWQTESWERVTEPFPDVINNVGGGRRTHAERKLRRQIPFTSFHVGNKYSLPKRIVHYRDYAELLVPFKVCTDEAMIHNFLEENNSVVFKALAGNRGENIYFVTKKGNRYTMLDQKKQQILNQDAFHEWLQTIIFNKKGSYIIQRYIHTRTRNDEPYHIRAHVQKDKEGKWHLTHIYPRVGNRRSNLSNISTEGRVEDLLTFLENEYGEQGKKHEQAILKLSMDLAWHLDKLHGLALDELGIDLAIDENGRYWMHEANNGPQTAYHEEKRAVNTIGYAKYIARNGLVHTDSMREASKVKGQFNARTTKLPFSDDSRPSVGMLLGEQKNDNITMGSVHAAEEATIQFYSFTPKDIDYDEMLIRGFFYENNEWIAKIVEYPDVIFDRLKLKGAKKAKVLYEELEDIPFTNEWPSQSVKRSDLYKSLQTNQDLPELMVPFESISRTRDVFRFIEKHGNVIIKPEIGSLSNSISIKKITNGKFSVGSKPSVQEYNEFSLSNTLKKILENKKYFIQKDPNKEELVNVHMMKGKDNNWIFVNAIYELNNMTEKENLLESETDSTIPMKLIKKTCLKVVDTIETTNDETISEVEIRLSIGQIDELHLIEVNPNGPEIISDLYVYAKNVMSYAGFLIELSNIEGTVEEKQLTH